MLIRLPKFHKREGVEDLMAIEVEHPEVIRLLHIFYYHIELLTVLFLYEIQGQFVGDKLFDPLATEFFSELIVPKRLEGGQY